MYVGVCHRYLLRAACFLLLASQVSLRGAESLRSFGLSVFSLGCYDRFLA